MNFAGKLMVLLTGAVSLICLIIGTMLYSQPMDYVTPKEETPKKVATRIDQAIARTNELLKANNRAYTRWVQESEKVLDLEVEQHNRREFYRGQLELVATGMLDGKKVTDPVQELTRDAGTNMLLIDKPTGRAAVKINPRKNAEAQKVYEDGIQAAVKKIAELQAETQMLLMEHVAATLVINGAEVPAVVKGLRTKIKEQIKIAEDADLERTFLEDFITNRRADSELFVKRRDALQSSIEQLNEYNKKKLGGQGN
ncbi:MAG: hypothetical protein K8T89_15510 [Planctomycetes bacterium]|nr:hypothetical protein [Planctomycetota bacterium]